MIYNIAWNTNELLKEISKLTTLKITSSYKFKKCLFLWILWPLFQSWPPFKPLCWVTNLPIQLLILFFSKRFSTPCRDKCSTWFKMAMIIKPKYLNEIIGLTLWKAWQSSGEISFFNMALIEVSIQHKTNTFFSIFSIIY